MDITEFRVIRTPVADDLGSLTLPVQVRPPASGAGGADSHIPPPITVSELPAEFGDRELDPLEPTTPRQLDTPLQRCYYVVAGASLALVRANDWMSGDDLSDRVVALRHAASIDGADWPLAIQVAQICLTDRIVTAIEANDPAEYVRATDLTRLALVCDLVARDEAKLRQLHEAQVSALVTGRGVILPAGVAAALKDRSRVKLIRDATVSDLHVIRREWSCYILGEVANIRNVMAGETFSLTNTKLDEHEAIGTTEATQQVSTEQEDSSKLSTELSQEVSTQINLAVNGHFDASVQYKTPVATINIGGGADVSLSLQRSEKFASKVAREAVTRAVRKVDTRTRETQSTRELHRSEDVTHYEVANKGDNLHAVYRWVDRVDRYQLFRYPERLQLEFQLPEPAEFYRTRTRSSAQTAAGVDKPPEKFDVSLDDIRADNLTTLAATYQASNLPSVPDEHISLTRTITIDIAKEALPDTSTQLNAPSQSKELDIPIPTSYCATGVTYSGHGYPIWAKWREGSTTVSADVEGFHSGFAAVSAGDRTIVDWVGGYRQAGGGGLEFYTSYGDNRDKGSVGAIQVTDQALSLPVRSAPYGRATLVIGQDTDNNLQPDASAIIPFDPGVSLSLKVGVSTAGLAGCIVTFLVTCARTDQALLAWQMSVYDALFSAWNQWKKDYESAQLRKAVTGSTGSDAGSSTRNDEVIREELKRQVISWLLNEEDFAGRPALSGHENAAHFRSIDFDLARQSALTIQFLEQAFEWGNLMYMFYPYYWADSGSWESLAQLTANDPEFERFLRAGSARVVVAARPGFNDAVKNWLQFQVPFLTGQLPAIDDPLHIAIDREIRDLTAPWAGGIAEDWWESRVTTTMLYLEENAAMPIKNDAASLPVAKNEVYKPKAISA